MEEEHRLRTKEEYQQYQKDQFALSERLDLSTDEGFSEFCRLRWRNFYVISDGGFWRPRASDVKRNPRDSYDAERRIPIDDVIDSLIGASAAPRIDLNHSKWQHW